MAEHILIPLDGSELAECALEHLKAIAIGCCVPEVVLLRVVEPTYAVGDVLSDSEVMITELNNQIQKAAELYITDVTDKFKQKYGINTQPALVYGSAANEILEYTKNNQVDLIIMTTHGRSGLSRWLLGNVADRVSHHSTVPVLIIAPASCKFDSASQDKKEKAQSVTI